MTPDLPPARFEDRLIAFFIDLALFGCGYGFCRGISAALDWSGSWNMRFWAALWASLFCAYQGWFLSRTGQTWGKRLLGLRVVTYGDTLPNCKVSPYNPPFGAALARTLGYIVSSTFMNLGFLWALWGKDKRAWHDLLAGTRVVSVRERSRSQKMLLSIAGWMIALLWAALWWRRWGFIPSRPFPKGLPNLPQ